MSGFIIVEGRGLTVNDDSLPDRLTKVPQDKDPKLSVVRLDKMLPKYCKVRGWKGRWNSVGGEIMAIKDTSVITLQNFEIR